MQEFDSLDLLLGSVEAEQNARDDLKRALRLALRTRSQRALASELGISQPAIAQRLKGYESAYDNEALYTLTTVSTDIAQQLKGNESLSAILRTLAQAITDFRSLRLAHDQRYFLRSPDTTGDPRFDALIAGLAEREARRAGVRAPLWTKNDAYVLSEAWFVTDVPGLRAMIFRDSPPEFALRNVYLDPRELESV
jgi:predicted transcriptional regulator